MKALYLDCISGIAGDMTLAALVDLGADLSYIVNHLQRLPIDPFDIHMKKVVKKGISAQKLHLHFEMDHHHTHGKHEQNHHHEHRRAADILSMIQQSDLPERVKQRSRDVFQAVAVAEGKIHGIDPEEVHFHEVGAMDSIIDTIGVCLALENLDIDEIYASPVPTGHGMVPMAHGLYPIPAPATAELLTGVPLAELDVQGELTTPTGAGILKALVKKFGWMNSMTIEKIGYGAGEKELDHPNVLRAVLCQPVDSVQPIKQPESREDREPIFVLEAQMDDITGECLGFAMERLFEAGALDVYFTPIQMKKNRPGTLLTVLATPDTADRCEKVILIETTTLGVRRSLWTRRILDRQFRIADTPYGQVKVKQALWNGKLVHEAPEYEDAAKLARQHGVPLSKIYQAVLTTHD